MRILLVDDEAAVTEVMQRSLLREKDMQVFTANSGMDALNLLAKEDAVDVVISDVSMPVMDGAKFLKTVRERHPGCLRLALSERVDNTAGLRVMNHAHQFLAKPCSAEELRQTIQRAYQMRALLEATAVKSLIGAIDKFPQAPGTAVALSLLIEDDASSLADIAAVVTRDAALSAKVLQLTNSAFFAFASPTTNVAQAVTRLGVSIVRSLSLTTGILEKADRKKLSIDLDRMNDANVQASLLARHLVTDPAERDLAGSAALLAHLGVIAIAAYDSERWQEMMGNTREWRTDRVSELIHYDCTHAQVGAYLLALWGLPMPVANIVLCHHDLLPPPDGRIDALSAVVAACSVVETGALPEGWTNAPTLQRFHDVIAGFTMDTRR